MPEAGLRRDARNRRGIYEVAPKKPKDASRLSEAVLIHTPSVDAAGVMVEGKLVPAALAGKPKFECSVANAAYDEAGKAFLGYGTEAFSTHFMEEKTAKLEAAKMPSPPAVIYGVTAACESTPVRTYRALDLRALPIPESTKKFDCRGTAVWVDVAKNKVLGAVSLRASKSAATPNEKNGMLEGDALGAVNRFARDDAIAAMQKSWTTPSRAGSSHARASRIRLNGVSVARRNER